MQWTLSINSHHAVISYRSLVCILALTVTLRGVRKSHSNANAASPTTTMKQMKIRWIRSTHPSPIKTYRASPSPDHVVQRPHSCIRRLLEWFGIGRLEISSLTIGMIYPISLWQSTARSVCKSCLECTLRRWNFLRFPIPRASSSIHTLDGPFGDLAWKRQFWMCRPNLAPISVL